MPKGTRIKNNVTVFSFSLPMVKDKAYGFFVFTIASWSQQGQTEIFFTKQHNLFLYDEFWYDCCIAEKHSNI
jgi:hypothetical protein